MDIFATMDCVAVPVILNFNLCGSLDDTEAPSIHLGIDERQSSIYCWNRCFGLYPQLGKQANAHTKMPC